MHQSSYHDGERAVQERAGQAATARRNAAILSGSVLAAARPFIAEQSMVAVASIDAVGAVWASLLFGEAGFMHSEDGAHISIDLPPSQRDGWDPLWDNLSGDACASGGDALGLLFIDLGTRRRYRVNGKLARLDGQGIGVAVQEAFPNCPKYIQRRSLRHLETASGAAGEMLARGHALDHGLDDRAAALLAQADTVFLASRHPERGADVSHRGGNPGFVSMSGARTLRFPDYHGNGMFQSLGNLQIDPRAGLCIPDFASGRLLQLTGTACLQWDQPDPANQTGGTGRFLELTVDHWILRRLPQRLEWDYIDASPYLPDSL
jgi:predicted pyridoxine 5'-phosphate oxidase superfamily flavin-nucleotide-binding protein